MVKKIKFSRVKNVKSPERAHSTDAGIDFYIPKDAFYNDFIDLKPQESTLIKSGIKVKLPEGYALVFFNKSGIATKLGLLVGACVVDENYSGELHLNLINVSNKITRLKNNMKIVQALLIKTDYVQLEEVPFEQLYSEETTRGSGGFGSTGD